MNHVTLLGRLTKAPELKYTSANNTAVVSFALAVNRRIKSQGQQEADFINCQAWSKTAEFIAKHFDKGSQVAVVGRLQVRSWDDNEGKKHYVTEVVVEEVYFADSKKTDSNNNNVQNNAQSSNLTVDEYDDSDSLPF